jgi:hypothetical protein
MGRRCTQGQQSARGIGDRGLWQFNAGYFAARSEWWLKHRHDSLAQGLLLLLKLLPYFEPGRTRGWSTMGAIEGTAKHTEPAAACHEGPCRGISHARLSEIFDRVLLR